MKTEYKLLLWFFLLFLLPQVRFAFGASIVNESLIIQDPTEKSGSDFASSENFRQAANSPRNDVGKKFEDSVIPFGNEAKLLTANGKQSAVPGKTAINKMPESDPMKLSLQDFVGLVLRKNEQIGIQQSELAVKRESVQVAKAIFEPAFVGAYQYQEDNRRNTVQEIIAQSFTAEAELHEKSRNYQAGIEGLVPTGARMSLGYQLRDFSNNIIKRYNVDRESVTVLAATLTQPLLKGGGIQPTMAGIRVAESDAEIEFQNYRELAMRVLSQAIAAYWDLYIAGEKYKVRTDSVLNAEQLLNDNIVRVQTGKMAETEVLEAKAGYALRRSLQSEARQQVIFSTNNVRNFFSNSVAEKGLSIEPVDRIEIENMALDFTDSVVKAFKMRAEYLSVHRKITREEIKVAFAENQRWPQLDMKASYGLNGLATDTAGSWDEVQKSDYDTWSVGLEFRIPLGGDRKSRGELEASKQRKKQALLELKAVEVAMINAVDTSIRSVLSSQDQLKHYADVVDFNKLLLEAEVARFQAGKSNSRLLLEKEEDLNQAKEAHLESLLKYAKAILGLKLSEGSLLVKYGIESMKVN